MTYKDYVEKKPVKQVIQCRNFPQFPKQSSTDNEEILFELFLCLKFQFKKLGHQKIAQNIFKDYLKSYFISISPEPMDEYAYEEYPYFLKSGQIKIPHNYKFEDQNPEDFAEQFFSYAPSLKQLRICAHQRIPGINQIEYYDRIVEQLQYFLNLEYLKFSLIGHSKSENDFDLELLNEQLQFLKQLRYLELDINSKDRLSDIQQILDGLEKQLPNLEYLNITVKTKRGEFQNEYENLGKYLKKFINLKVLSIDCDNGKFYFDSSKDPTLYENGSYSKNLQKSLEDNEQSVEEYQNINFNVDFLENLYNLESLKMNIQDDSKYYENLFNKLGNLVNLKELQLKFNTIFDTFSDDLLQLLQGSLKKMKENLETLILHFNNDIFDEEEKWDLLGQSLAEAQNLKRLSLFSEYDNKFGYMKDFFKQIQKLKKIQDLSIVFHSNEFDDKQLGFLFNSIYKYHDLKYLNLSFQIELGRSLKGFIKGIEKLISLRKLTHLKLTIQYFRITPELLYSQKKYHEKEVQELIDVLNKLNYLQDIDIFVYSDYFSSKISEKVQVRKRIADIRQQVNEKQEQSQGNRKKSGGNNNTKRKKKRSQDY